MADTLLDEVAAGSVLKTDVSDRKGNILLREGVALTDRHLKLLHAQGIAQVDIVAALESQSAPEENLTEEQAAALVERQFRNTDADHPLIQELKRVCIGRRQQNPLKGK